MADLRRNLIYYCYPRSAGGRWRRSAEHLLARWEIFTGRKLVTISVDGCCDDPADVEELFAGRGCEFRVVENLIDPARAAFRGLQGGLQEAAHFGAMLRDLETGDPNSITLYCHAKGCTHADAEAPSHKWCDAMAAACLDYPQLVDCVFASGKHVAGAFRVNSGWGFPGYHDWHFAGTWFWFRNLRALELGVRDCQPVFYGVEAWPGAFPREDGFCLFCDHSNSHILYQNDWWRDHIGPSLGYWRQSLARCGLQPLAGVPAVAGGPYG